MHLNVDIQPYIHSLLFLDMEFLYDTPYIRIVQNIRHHFLLITLKIVHLNPWNDLNRNLLRLDTFAKGLRMDNPFYKNFLGELNCGHCSNKNSHISFHALNLIHVT